MPESRSETGSFENPPGTVSKQPVGAETGICGLGRPAPQGWRVEAVTDDAGIAGSQSPTKGLEALNSLSPRFRRNGAVMRD